jgi:hypothetical protein
MDLMFSSSDEQINGLYARLRASSQTEEQIRKAVEDLTPIARNQMLID